jgi:hypothetical protein
MGRRAHVHTCTRAAQKGGEAWRRRGAADLSIRRVVFSQFGETGIQFPRLSREDAKDEPGDAKHPVVAAVLKSAAGHPYATRHASPISILRALVCAFPGGEGERERSEAIQRRVGYNNQSLEDKEGEG